MHQPGRARSLGVGLSSPWHLSDVNEKFFFHIVNVAYPCCTPDAIGELDVRRWSVSLPDGDDRKTVIDEVVM